MADFAPVVPIGVAEKMAEANILGKYHLLLAHDVVKHPKRYADVYANLSYGTKIMDNSVIELGHPIDKGMMKEACEIVEADVAVLPDELLDRKGTIDSTLGALDSWMGVLSPSIACMAVPQGQNTIDWLECCEEFVNVPEIKWIGIPRNYREKHRGSRINAVTLVKTLRADWNIHLLGFSEDMDDDVLSCKVSNAMGFEVKGIDSTVPIRIAMRDKKTLKLSGLGHSSRGDWWDNPGNYDETADLVAKNMQLISTWIK